MRWSTTKWGNSPGYRGFIYTGKPGCHWGSPAFPSLISPASSEQVTGVCSLWRIGNCTQTGGGASNGRDVGGSALRLCMCGCDWGGMPHAIKRQSCWWGVVSTRCASGIPATRTPARYSRPQSWRESTFPCPRTHAYTGGASGLADPRGTVGSVSCVAREDLTLPAVAVLMGGLCL